MLILTRRVGESIRIGDDIEVTITTIKGREVRLGIRAPLEVRVDRSEVYEWKKLDRNKT